MSEKQKNIKFTCLDIFNNFQALDLREEVVTIGSLEIFVVAPPSQSKIWWPEFAEQNDLKIKIFNHPLRLFDIAIFGKENKLLDCTVSSGKQQRHGHLTRLPLANGVEWRCAAAFSASVILHRQVVAAVFSGNMLTGKKKCHGFDLISV
ncbi:hypothetical protein LXL04_006316 [Taraxacum kok-saghyz]